MIGFLKWVTPYAIEACLGLFVGVGAVVRVQGAHAG